MAKYIIKRVLLAIITIFLVATLTFFLMNAVPGGPYEAEKAISPQAKAALEAKFGLDQPLGQQYITYMKNILHGDFGPSLKQRGREVKDIIFSKFPVSAKVGGISVLVLGMVFLLGKSGSGKSKKRTSTTYLLTRRAQRFISVRY